VHHSILEREHPCWQRASVVIHLLPQGMLNDRRQRAVGLGSNLFRSGRSAKSKAKLSVAAARQ
jgi:hypothetical protein